MSDPASLTHVDSDGRARMVDIEGKAVTKRVATASGRLETTAEVVALVKADGMPKADVLPTARIAGIMGAKKTSELIPLCHPIPITGVTIEFGFTETAITIRANAKTTGTTGIEMEALTAVAVAGLTLHDMVKAVDPAATLTEVRLESKTGGKRGNWNREGIAGLREGTAAVLVASTRAADGTRPDETGPVIEAWLRARGYTVDAVTVVADADVAHAVSSIVATGPAVLITTGGTGLSPSDRTPEATRAVLDRELPGIAEAIRARGMQHVPTAALSRGLAGVAGGTVVVNLPGSRGGVDDGLAVLDELLGHLVAQITGASDHGH
jgi:cyclic pyranopterin phosphate synthase